ncbi:UDP-glucose 4-epimerase family protein [Endozoicomonas sp. ALC020]|uniref:UDP-glucose 4-epimerase family protein n=1 Tax=unclassified Endozoicomonas TaxID=2644528 RepID=UPI003BAE4CA9
MTILITGATGFIGKSLVNKLKTMTLPYRCCIRDRTAFSDLSPEKNIVIVGNIDGKTDWRLPLRNIKIVIHLAARAHITVVSSSDSRNEYKKINTDGTLNLARQAAKAGVQRFIFISTIKVNGETTSGLPAFNETSKLTPQDPYAISKCEAEIGLKRIINETGMDLVIIRSPLVYGPGVKANFFSLMKLADSSLPLPFGAINNSRSMLYVGNLADFIVRCIDHPAAANQTFLISDNNDLSLAMLVRLLRTSLGRSVHLLPIPSCMLRAVAILVGKRELTSKLIGDLQVDPAKAIHLLDWEPPYSVEQGIQATVAAYSQGKDKE